MTKIFVFLVVIIMLPLVALLPVYHTYAQEHQCPTYGINGTLPFQSHSLLYFDSVDGEHYSLYVYETNISRLTEYQLVTRNFESRMSPDNTKLAVAYPNTNDSTTIEVLDLSTFTVSTFELHSNDQYTLVSSSIEWKDDTSITLLTGQSSSQHGYLNLNVATGDIQLIDLPPYPQNDEIFLPRYSLDYSSVYFASPVGDSAIYNVELRSLVDKHEPITFQSKSLPSWVLNSNLLFYVDVDNQLHTIDSDGSDTVTNLELDDIELIQFSPSYSGSSLIATSRFIPRQPETILGTMFVDMELGSIVDICSYGYRAMGIRAGLYNELTGLWSDNDSMFAFTLQGHFERTIFVFSPQNWSITTIPISPEGQSNYLRIVGWVEG